MQREEETETEINEETGGQRKTQADQNNEKRYAEATIEECRTA